MQKERTGEENWSGIWLFTEQLLTRQLDRHQQFLLMGRYPRTKLPELSQPTHSDEETRDRDQLKKFKGKQYADASRSANMSEVKEGDLVLMKQDKKNKLSTTFEPQLYKVKEKKGNQVVVSDSDNPARVLHRNTIPPY